MKTLLITGANRGIGLEFCKQYAAAGWRVLACCRDPHKADALNKLVKRYPNLVKLHALDVTDHAQIEQLARTLSDKTIDLLINNAGVYPSADKRGFGHTDYAEWMSAFNINTMAPLKMVEAFKIEKKKHFYNLKPHKRPFFYPGSMSPKLARCMVNLTGVRKGDLVLDPFCGTGGILLEAGIMGAKVIGVDIDEKMVNGTIKNLNYCGVKDYNVFQGDARRINLPNKVKAIATDPPYGISASTGGEESQNLYAEALVTMEEILMDTGRLCMATPHYMDIEELVQGTNFEIIEQHHIRMHKSLTRVISILKKSLK